MKANSKHLQQITLTIDGQSVTVPEGWTVAAALAHADLWAARRSASGTRRGPVCGMGVCYECRVTIDGHQHALSCRTLCTMGMIVKTDG